MMDKKLKEIFGTPLTQRELLVELRFMNDQASGILDSVCTKENTPYRQQAYTQLKEIVEEWFLTPQKKGETHAEYIARLRRIIARFRKKVGKLEQQKPTVTKEEIAKMLKKLNYAIFSTTIDGMCEMLKELGMEVK